MFQYSLGIYKVLEMVYTAELLKLVEKVNLSRQDFSRKLNRSPHFVNIYLCKFKDKELPVKCSCLIAHHFARELKNLIGAERFNKIKEMSKRLNYDPQGTRNTNRETSRLKRKVKVPVEVNVLKLDFKVVNKHDRKKFKQIAKSVRKELREDHPELERNLNVVHLNYLIGQILIAASKDQADELMNVVVS